MDDRRPMRSPDPCRHARRFELPPISEADLRAVGIDPTGVENVGSPDSVIEPIGPRLVNAEPARSDRDWWAGLVIGLGAGVVAAVTGAVAAWVARR